VRLATNMLSRATGRKRKSIERERKESFLSSFIIYNCTVAHAQKKKQSKPTEVKAFFVPSRYEHWWVQSFAHSEKIWKNYSQI